MNELKDIIGGINNYCQSFHIMNEDRRVFNNKNYRCLSRSLNNEFFNLENQCFFEYEKWILKE